MRVDLKAKYEDRFKLKALGARWDDARRTWYVENVENLVPFLPWIKASLKRPCAGKTKTQRAVTK